MDDVSTDAARRDAAGKTAAVELEGLAAEGAQGRLLVMRLGGEGQCVELDVARVAAEAVHRGAAEKMLRKKPLESRLHGSQS